MFDVYANGKCDAVFPQDRRKPVLHKSSYTYGVTTIFCLLIQLVLVYPRVTSPCWFTSKGSVFYAGAAQLCHLISAI